MTEFKLGKHTIKFTPHNIIPINSNEERTVHTTIEIYQKRLGRRSKLVKSIKYMPSPALTVRGFFQILAK